MTTTDLTQYIEGFLTDVWRFTFEKPNNNRSTIKTNILHSGVEGMLLPLYNKKPNLKLFTENTKKKLSINDVYEGKFNVDLLLKDGKNIHTVIPVKMNMISINKNKFNNGNTIIGEAARSTPSSHVGRNVLFINFNPVDTLNTTKNKILKFQHVDTVDIMKAFNSPLYNHEYVQEHITVLDIKYKLNINLREISSEEQLKEALTIDNPISLIPNALDDFHKYGAKFLTQP